MMIHSSSETAGSPTPISPFSTYSAGSEATSDEAPDLGAFNIVFREFQHRQIGPPRILYTAVDSEHEFESTSSQSGQLSAVVYGTDSEANAGSTVWNQGIVASYLELSGSSAVSRSTAENQSAKAESSTTDYEREHGLEDDSYDDSYGPEASESETEGEMEPRTFTIGSVESDGADPDHPTLGTIDSVIQFLIAERDRVQATRQVGAAATAHYSSTSDTGVRLSQDIEVKRVRKRRRKRPPKLVQILKRDGEQPEVVSETTVLAEDASRVADHGDQERAEVEHDSSSSLDNRIHYKSTPSTPPQAQAVPLRRDALKHSKSTPTLQVKTIPPDPQILKLRCLAHKLRLKFPEDYDRITALLTQDFSGGDSDFSDPRGPAPRARDTLIHVFVDHSNILIGLLTYHKKHRSSRRPKRLSHTALALLLERGRPITRRCMVTSSPLYQPIDTAEQLGYEVRIYARVPDNGDGQDRRVSHSHNQTSESAASRSANWRKSDAGPSTFTKGHSRRHSGGNTSTDSDRNGRSVTAGGTIRVRYREQGVDELLQLKLHTAIADADPTPPNATIVLATGDGNIGQFHDEGFLGPVRLALKRGWKVELYAWEDGLSRAWKREFSEGPYRNQFRIIKMEDFAEDLLEVDAEGK